jgi:L-alanine-DL-glutamate epimerase-like enolase superfamily enzyme
MKLSLYRLALPLEHEFTISRGSMTSQETLIVGLEHEGHVGLGEATANRYYGRTLDSMVESIGRVQPLLEAYRFGNPEELWQRLNVELADDSFSLCALDLAAHDLFGKLAGRSLIDLWGLDAHDMVESSYTIGIDTIDAMVDKLNEQPGWGIYKIKLTTDDDIAIVRALRNHTDAVFRVDANCGWTAEETICKSRALAELNVEFIEQPLPADADERDALRVYEESALPIIADESCLVESDVADCAGRFHGVNVKLCKCGGLTPALRMLREARGQGMRTMVGCMVESSVGISAAAQLLPLLDYADLDGAVLLRDEPAQGVRIQQGRVLMSETPGTGAQLNLDRLGEFAVDVAES